MKIPTPNNGPSTRTSALAKPIELVRARRSEFPLTTELRGLIDRVIVPILVRHFISDMAPQKQIAERVEEEAICGPTIPEANPEGTR
jgi:hypothetical protein